MKRSAWIAVILLAAISQGVFAAEIHLNEQQKLGRRLFEQSCGVCHTRPTLLPACMVRNSPKRAPAGGKTSCV